MLYFSLIYPAYLFYCVSVWASTYPSKLRRLITVQKRVVRIMSRSAFDAHTNTLFKNLKILNFENRLFSLTWSASMQIYWNKRKRLHKKRVQLPEDWFGTPIWPPWRHVKTLYIYKLQMGKFMYQYKSGLLPYSFNNMFLVTCQVHSYGTRSSELFYLPQCRTNIRKFSISFQGPKFFNSLSFEIRNAISTASFCCKLKAFLLS